MSEQGDRDDEPKPNGENGEQASKEASSHENELVEVAVKVEKSETGPIPEAVEMPTAPVGDQPSISCSLLTESKPDPPSVIDNSIVSDDESDTIHETSRDPTPAKVPRGAEKAQNGDAVPGSVELTGIEEIKDHTSKAPAGRSSSMSSHVEVPREACDAPENRAPKGEDGKSEDGSISIQIGETDDEMSTDKMGKASDEPQPHAVHVPPVHSTQQHDGVSPVLTTNKIEDTIAARDVGNFEQMGMSTALPPLPPSPATQVVSAPSPAAAAAAAAVSRAYGMSPTMEMTNTSPPAVMRDRRNFGPDEDVIFMPRVDEHLPGGYAAYHAQQHTTYRYSTVHRHGGTSHPGLHAMAGGGAPPPSGGGRRKIRLRLQEDVRQAKRSLMTRLRHRSQRIFGSEERLLDEPIIAHEDRGTMTVSWFDGTSSLELHEHVRDCIIRKLQLPKYADLADIRLIDETGDPPEEIVLCPYIPDGSRFLLRFTITDSLNDGTASPLSTYSGRAPESPSAAPSPHPSNSQLSGLNANQLALLQNQLNSFRTPKNGSGAKTYIPRDKHDGKPPLSKKVDDTESGTTPEPRSVARAMSEDGEEKKTMTPKEGEKQEEEEEEDDMLLHSEDPIEGRLREITELLLSDRQRKRGRSGRREDKQQVVFTLANYFVLFLSLIAISAEIQARAPNWLSSLEQQMQNVHDCAKDQDALFKCVSNGDFAGLVASVILWLSRSVATRRIFLFGFDSQKKLWTVVYESLVTAVCWGFSYIFIRRGMNPDTRHRFLQKYWKDAVYGSLAGFNAAFMKQVLKNLIPQEAVEDALRERQLKILSWLPSFS